MTPDLLAEFADAMADLRQARAALEVHGPEYLRQCVEANRRGALHRPPRPAQLPAPIAQLIRDVADDAAVRSAAAAPWGAR